MLHQDQAAAARPPGRLARFATRIDVTAVIVALLLAGFFVVGASFAATNSSAWFSGSAGAAFGAFLAVLVIAAALYLAIRLLYRWLDRRWDATAESAAGIIPMRKALRRWFWPSFAAVYAGWLGWLLIHFPGSVDSDTITQLYQWLGLAAKVDHHPWFDTMIFGWFFDLGRAVGNWNVGLFAFLFVQVTASAAGMALALTYLARLGLSKGPRRVLTAFVAVFPVFAMSVSVMSKDSFGQVFWLPFVVMYVEALRTRGRFLCRPWIGLAAIALTIPLVLAKRTNVYVVVLCLIVLLVVSAWRTAARLAIGAVVVVAVTNLLWPHVVLPALGVAPGTGTDALTIPLQQTARTVRQHGASLPASERAAIDAVLRYQGLAKAYDPRRSDAVKGRWRAGTTSAERLAYLRTWLAEGLRYPGTYLAATANNTYEYFAPLTPMNFQTDLDLRRYVDILAVTGIPEHHAGPDHGRRTGTAPTGRAGARAIDGEPGQCRVPDRQPLRQQGPLRLLDPAAGARLRDPPAELAAGAGDRTALPQSRRPRRQPHRAAALYRPVGARRSADRRAGDAAAPLAAPPRDPRRSRTLTMPGAAGWSAQAMRRTRPGSRRE